MTYFYFVLTDKHWMKQGWKVKWSHKGWAAAGPEDGNSGNYHNRQEIVAVTEVWRAASHPAITQVWLHCRVSCDKRPGCKQKMTWGTIGNIPKLSATSPYQVLLNKQRHYGKVHSCFLSGQICLVVVSLVGEVLLKSIVLRDFCFLWLRKQG